MDDPRTNRTPADEAVDQRLWEWVVHEDSMIYERGNLFLVAQSLLVVAYSTVLTTDQTAARVIAAFGLPLTFVWLYAGHRHLRYSTAVQARTAEKLPDYAATRAATRQAGVRATPVIVYALPSLASIMWIVLLVIS
ncbi:hypothetical protein OH738_09485 [Streptomyces hirsutus]|uniref:Uncharacterized protein n=1 Tax=Streptomyces hirsutus TaxID=35620 RepID=A0ABZ1GTP0_9ACTN|nr:hypothetical protein [Streptomyces hirsutus]WSD09568.1 hypothetical protein OIE73_30040 [Streptomyces hirsutus]WTD16990.1 hypothetical protein OH738_09485 [Streptomyces hirsutus]WTD78028.1 hypothetical protein OHB56_31695 [Streptomyces sp. NBC_01635]